MVLGMFGCGSPPEPKTADAVEDPATRWEAAPGQPAGTKPGPKETSVDLDSTSAASASSDIRANIAGKDVVFKQSRIHGNAREGFGLHAFEAAAPGQAGKAELNAKLSGALVKGKPIAVTLHFLQIADATANSLRGVRALDCAGKGKVTFDSLPTIPKEIPKDEIDVGEAVGSITIAVKCSGDAKDYGAFEISGKLSAQVLVAPEL